jgi:hypothetical protein
MTDTPTTVLVDADKIVADAERALVAIDGAIAAKRAEKAAAGAEIALLLNDRKPLARIVSAARGRKSNGDS